MKQSGSEWRWCARRLAYLLAGALLFAGLLSLVLDRAAGNADTAPGWASPNAMALKRVSDIDSAQHEANFLSNLDCTPMEYRLPNSGTMQTGCFMATAFGLMDADSGIVIFNGTDEGLPLLPYSAQQVSVPWPQAGGLIALEPVSTGGSYVGFYRNPLASMQDQRDAFSKLVAKKLAAGPDLIFKDSSGQPLVVNPQTMAFSDNGDWLAAETLNGSFVRINLATLDVVAFAPSFGATGSPGLLKSQVAVSGDGRYVAIDNDDAAVLRVYDLAACDGVVNGLQPQKCAAHDYMPFIRQQIADFHAVRHLRFINEGLLSFDGRTNNPAGGGVYELAPRDTIGPLIDYLALGDSYTSGEGAFDYLAGTDTDDDMCHLSANSYPLLLTRALFGSAGGHSVACSGAVINDLGNTGSGYRGQVKDVLNFSQLQQTQPALLNSIMAGYLPGYVAQQRFVRQYQPAVITVSAGGDDVGFGDIVKSCVMPHLNPLSGDNTCYGTYEDRLELTQLIDRTGPRWTALYKQLAGENPGGQIYAIGYPQIAVANGNCGLNVHLNKAELEFAGGMIDYLDDAIRQASDKAGVAYVDVSQALAGHRLCETAGYNVAVNGLTAGTDGSVLGVRVFGKESYHPNALGQALIEQAILEQTHNLAAAPAITSGVDGQSILDAPKTGRIVNVLVPDDGLTAEIIRAGETTAVQANGGRDGLKADTIYTLRLDDANGTVIGTAASNANGDISTGVKLPDGTPAGGHTIDVTGPGEAAEPVDVRQPVYVPADGYDSDGDGIADTADSCPGAANSGRDDDHDGIDDACDNSINPPLTVGQGNSSSPGSNGASGGSGNLQGNATDDINGVNPGSLGGQLPTIVTSFSATRPSRPMTAIQAAGQSQNNISGLARVSGKAGVSPASVSAADFRTLVKPGAADWLIRPPATDRLPWFVLLVVIWLLVVLGLWLNRLAGRRDRDVYN